MKQHLIPMNLGFFNEETETHADNAEAGAPPPVTPPANEAEPPPAAPPPKPPKTYSEKEYNDMMVKQLNAGIAKVMKEG
ncbi:MAG: hypothetical protein LBE35_04645 [Clostridiales bacterium]|nr:hypothetical protein [Clostridiales bacterium]